VPDLTNWDVRILATDIDSTVLDRGREGVYRKKQIEPVPPMLRQKYLIRQGTRQEPEFLVRPELKRLVAFRHLNLMTTPYPFQGPFQVIFCRNVMIYFRRDTQAELVNRFFHLLSPGGYLFVGHSESLTGIQHPFQYIRPTVYRRPE
jgi:chemotaxis protein methyltransferase CheR